MTIAADIKEVIGSLKLVQKFFHGSATENVTPYLPTLAKAVANNFNKGVNNTGISLGDVVAAPWTANSATTEPTVGTGNNVLVKVVESRQGDVEGHISYYRVITEQ